jgi:hypothetical protein
MTAARGLIGDGVILEAAEPAKGNDHFRQVSHTEINVFDMAVFNNWLYVGAYDGTRGYAVWKTDATGPAPYQFVPVVTDGAGRGALVQSVVSMHVFKGYLYVGSNGIFPRVLPPCELIRIHPDDSWELVVGRSRRTSQGVKKPISNFPDSFGNPLISHFWRMQDHEDVLYLGTNDSSAWFQVPPRLDARINHEYGFDLWLTKDGETWLRVTRDGFGDRHNFGARTLVSTPQGLFIGTANQVSGAEVWLVTAS